MKRGHSWFVLAAVLCCGLYAQAAEPAGNLYQLGIAMNQAGIRGGWSQIGEGGAWKAVRAGAILNDRLYTAETDGTLQMTKLGTGERTQIGQPDFGATVFIFSAFDQLWTIESSGTLYQVNPDDGRWLQVGTERGWQAVLAGAIHKGRLYTAEKDGTLQATNLVSGGRQQVGKAEFGNTVALLAAGDHLCTIETDGSCYRVDVGNGAWEFVGPAGGGKAPLAAVVVQDQLCRIEADGTLHEIHLPDGQRTQLGKADFGNTALMFAGNQQVYTVETDGNLYAVYLNPKENIDGWNCFPREFEKVFQEQARSFYRQSYHRQILGERATHAEIMNGIAWLCASATQHDMVVIYLTCHGGTDLNDGWGVGAADGKVILARELKVELARLPCHALVFIETCGSGGFAHPHKNDPPVPANVTAICACSDKQSSSNQLDIAALEALWGRADFSRDGVVELDELLRYVELRYQEMYPVTEKQHEALRPVMVRAKSVAGPLPLTKTSPQLGAVVHESKLYSALVTAHNGNTYGIHILGYNDRPGNYFITNTADRDHVCLPNEGPTLEVKQNGTWYPARLLSKMGGRYKVRYLGYNEEEIVTKQRIRYAFVGQPPTE